MKKVLIITYYWPPSGGAGVQRWVKLCKYLPKYGIQPVVLTVDPKKASYPTIDSSLENEVDPDLEVFRTNSFEPLKIYGGIVGEKKIPTAGFSNVDPQKWYTKVAARIRSTMFIPDPRLGWNKFALKKAKELILKKQIDKVITTGPPHSTHLIGLQLKKEFNIDWTADMRDPWTDIYYYKDLHHTKRSAAKDEYLEKKVLLGADRVLSVSTELSALFKSKCSGSDQSKFYVLHNGFDPDDFEDQLDDQQDTKFWITYTGTISEHYQPQIFLECLAQIVRNHPQVNLRLIGVVASGIIRTIKRLGIADHVEMIPTVPHNESIAYLQNSNVALLIIPEVAQDKLIVTGKLFEYLGAKKPIFCIGPKDGTAAQIIRECSAGRTFERYEPELMISFLEDLIGERTISIHHEKVAKYSRISQAKAIADIL